GPVLKRIPLGVGTRQKFEGSLATVVLSPDRKLFIVQPQPYPWGQPDPWGSRGATLWNTVTRMPIGRHISGGTFSPDGKRLHLNFSDLWGDRRDRKQEWLIDVPQPVRGTPEYLRLWIEVLTVSEQDSSGGV